MFFIPYRLYLCGMFLMQKGCLPGFRSWVDPATRSESLLQFKINVFRPATGLAVPPLHSTVLALLAEAGMKWALGSSFYLLAAAATTKSGPRK